MILAPMMRHQSCGAPLAGRRRAPGSLAALRAALAAHLTAPQPTAPGPDPALVPTGEAAPLPGRRATAAAPATSAAAPAGPPAAPADTDPVTSIVARAKQGDADAFAELYDRYLDVVFRYVYYRVGSHAQAEDLVSETFLRALRSITSFTWQGRDFAAWLITIARNLVADHYKSARYRLEVATADMLDADRAVPGPEEVVLDSLSNATLVEAVRQLAGEQQECVVLRFLQGLSVHEAALAMGKSDGAIKALQYRAVRSLSRLLPREMIL